MLGSVRPAMISLPTAISALNKLALLASLSTTLRIIHASFVMTKSKVVASVLMKMFAQNVSVIITISRIINALLVAPFTLSA